MYQMKYLGVNFFLTLFFFGISSLLIQAKAQDTAIIIGVGKYQDPKANLPGIDHDIDMAIQIAKRLGFDKIVTLRDHEATIDNIKQKIKNVATSTNEHDRILIYYSGHGSNIDDVNGDESDGRDETLYVYDGHLVDDDLNGYLNEIKSREMVILLDSCHSGTATKSLPQNRYGQNVGHVKAFNVQNNSTRGIGRKNFSVETTDTLSSAGYLAIGAAQDNQQALATSRGSYFTKALLENLENYRTKQKINPTWQEIFNSTKSTLKEITDQFSPNMDGNINIAKKQIKFANTPNSHGFMWNHVLNAVKQAKGTVQIDAPKALRLGDVLEFSVTSPIDGYLNVVAIGSDDKATLLFPNEIVSENTIKNKPILIPGQGKFRIRAVEPKGKTLVAAFVSSDKINLIDEGYGNKDKGGNPIEPFVQIDQGVLTRNLQVEGLYEEQRQQKVKNFYASYIEVDIQ